MIMMIQIEICTRPWANGKEVGENVNGTVWEEKEQRRKR